MLILVQATTRSRTPTGSPSRQPKSLTDRFSAPASVMKLKPNQPAAEAKSVQEADAAVEEDNKVRLAVCRNSSTNQRRSLAMNVDVPVIYADVRPN